MGLVSLIFRKRRALKRPAIWGPEDVERFLRVGRFTLTEYLNLSDETRAIVAQVEEAMRAEDVAAQGLAAQSPENATAILAKADGGESHKDLMMTSTLASVVESIRRAV